MEMQELINAQNNDMGYGDEQVPDDGYELNEYAPTEDEELAALKATGFFGEDDEDSSVPKDPEADADEGDDGVESEGEEESDDDELAILPDFVITRGEAKELKEHADAVRELGQYHTETRHQINSAIDSFNDLVEVGKMDVDSQIDSISAALQNGRYNSTAHKAQLYDELQRLNVRKHELDSAVHRNKEIREQVRNKETLDRVQFTLQALKKAAPSEDAQAALHDVVAFAQENGMGMDEIRSSMSPAFANMVRMAKRATQTTASVKEKIAASAKRAPRTVKAPAKSNAVVHKKDSGYSTGYVDPEELDFQRAMKSGILR